jgi:hypothetical protein
MPSLVKATKTDLENLIATFWPKGNIRKG